MSLRFPVPGSLRTSFFSFALALLLLFSASTRLGAQCNTNVTVCQTGQAGPFNFVNPGPAVGSCLDWIGPNVAYIMLYITQGGQLEMLIDGDANTGFLDVAVFDIPQGVPPCDAIQNNANEIGCNYATNASGCNQFGTNFGCASSVPSPTVQAGDVLMIVVENWSGASTNFTLELGPPPAAQSGPPDATIDPAGPFCLSDPSVQLTAQDMGGDWTGPGVTPDGIFDPSQAGIGTHTIDYSIGQAPCDDQDQTTIEVNCDCFSLDGVSITDPTCGNSNGSIDINASGGGTPYQYSIDGGASFQGSSSFSNLPAGTYNIVVSDDVGCTDDTSVTLTNTPPPTDLSFNLTDASCGNNNGEVEITGVTGGTAPYQYDFNGSGFSGTTVYSGLAPGTYTVTVQDDNGCTYQEDVTINNLGAPTIDNLIVTDNSCNGSCDGSIDIQASGGATPHQYSIDGGGSFQGGNVFTALCAGTYDVVVEDANGCQATGQVTVDEPAPLAYNSTVVDLACYQDNSGEIHFQNVTGGTSPYQYSIDGGVSFQGNASFTGLAAGTYDLILEDDNGCQISSQVQVNEPALLQFDDLILQDALCNGSCDGTAEALVSGGTTPYNYSWSGGIASTGSQANNICAGNYTLTVTDDNGCSIDTAFTIDEPTALSITTSSVNANCGKPDGSASVDNVSGGTAPYSYQWDDPGNQTTATATALTPGDYEVVVTDDNGCTFIDTVTVGNNDAHTVSVDQVIDATCNGGCDGEASININGGTAPFTYQWDDPSNQSTATATGLCAGTYKVVVTDDNGCEDSVQVTVNEPSAVQISTVPDTTICIGGTATLSANASGGTPGYTYHWDQGLGTGQTHTASPGSNTVYEVYAEDANGCFSDTQSVRVEYYPPLNVSASQDDSVCPDETVQISANGSGGIGSGYSFDWSNGDQGQSTNVAPSSTTTYAVTLEDACETPPVTDSVEIFVHPLPDVQMDGMDLSGCSPVQATLVNTTDPSMVGGDCEWDFGDGTQSGACDSVSHVYDAPGCYDVGLSVTSPEGCVDSTTAFDMVCVYEYPVADFRFDPEETTVQNPTISFTNLSTGATDHEWSFGELGTSEEEHPEFTFPAEEAGQYEVCLTSISNYGCRDSTCRTVSIGGRFILYVPNAFSPNGDGRNDRFAPVIQGADEKDYHFYVYDRWGQVVFETHHPEGGAWDGSINGSRAAKPDVYVWKLVTRNKYTGAGIERQGHVTLIR